jgi:hypothetical protein
MLQVLSGLRDVEGVFGSFVLAEAGQLLGKDLPAVFHDDVFAETGPRIVRLCEAIEHGGEAIDSLALRFADHKLHVRRSRGGLLCVIATLEANASALRMALSLVAKRLGAPEGAVSSEPPATATITTGAPHATVSAQSPISVEEGSAALQSARTYRGLRLG